MGGVRRGHSGGARGVTEVEHEVTWAVQHEGDLEDQDLDEA